MPLLLPLLLLGVGVAGLIIVATTSDDEPPVQPPDLPNAPPGQTRWKFVNAILPQLQAASQSSGLPMGLSVGWVAKESGGKLATKPQPGPGDTKYDERGYYQLMPDESKTLGLDHQRLSIDSTYSINGGLAAIAFYSGDADRLGVAPKGSAYFWRLVKLIHSMGFGAVKKIIDAAKAAGSAGSWESLKNYAMAHDAELLHATKHSPSKWLAFVDEVYSVGAPFGFGASDAIVGASGVTGGKIFDDIIDPLDCLT